MNDTPAVPPPAPTVLRRVAYPVGVLAGIGAAFGYVGTVDPNRPGHYPVCPFLYVTGLYCPLCGGLRSAHAVVHGDLAGALHDNVIAVAGYLVCAALWVGWISREARGRDTAVRVPPYVWWGLGALALVFTVVRNLPFGAALAPR